MQLLTQFLIIFGFTLIGEALHQIIHFPVPSSVYALFLLFLALCVGVVKVEQVKRAGTFLISLLPLLFVGPTVGIAEQWGLIAPNLIPIALILLASTVMTFGIAGLVTQRMLHRGGNNNE